VSLTRQKDDAAGELIPFPNITRSNGHEAAALTPTSGTGAVEAAAVEAWTSRDEQAPAHKSFDAAAAPCQPEVSSIAPRRLQGYSRARRARSRFLTRRKAVHAERVT
jgi:hypothetical protein